jgi:nicotinate dehydrogenase subunit B
MEEMTWDDQRITSVDWRTYRSLSLGSDMPEIETVLINRVEGEAMGAGELSITLSPAAIGNAIFDATGARLRQIPSTPERVLEALKART